MNTEQIDKMTVVELSELIIKLHNDLMKELEAKILKNKKSLAQLLRDGDMR